MSEIVSVMDEAGRRQTVLVSATLTAGMMSYLGALQSENEIQKSELTVDVGGWVGPGITRIFSVENRPKIGENQY